jgi:citrate synthase
MSDPAATGPGWRTRITSLDEHGTRLHGYDLLELAAAYDFVSISFLTWTGRLPSVAERRMLDLLMGCLVVHGIAPTGAIARGLARSGVPTQVGVAGALLSIGDVHGGAGERLGRQFDELEPVWPAGPGEVERAAAEVIKAFEGRGERVPGLGHAAHPEGDPRSVLILGRARELGVAGFHCAVMSEIEEQLARAKGRPIPCNVDGAMTAVLCDLGIDWRYSRVLIMTSRAAGLGAQVIEEELHPTPRWRDALLPREIYEGPPPRPVPPPTS